MARDVDVAALRAVSFIPSIDPSGRPIDSHGPLTRAPTATLACSPFVLSLAGTAYSVSVGPTSDITKPVTVDSGPDP